MSLPTKGNTSTQALTGKRSLAELPWCIACLKLALIRYVTGCCNKLVDIASRDQLSAPLHLVSELIKDCVPILVYRPESDLECPKGQLARLDGWQAGVNGCLHNDSQDNQDDNHPQGGCSLQLHNRKVEVTKVNHLDALA